jgi:hypothetical protein
VAASEGALHFPTDGVQLTMEDVQGAAQGESAS